MPIKAVIWDIGGVLIRTENPTPRAELATELGVTREYLVELVFGGEQGMRAQKGEISQRDIWDYARNELKLAPEEYPNLRERFFDGDILDIKLIEFIQALKPRYKIGIISNAWSELPNALEEWEIREVFDVIVGSGDEGVMKPDPLIYQIALERLDVKPKEAIFVDDFVENIQGAQALGINTVHFRNRKQAIQEVNTLLDQ